MERNSEDRRLEYSRFARAATLGGMLPLVLGLLSAYICLRNRVPDKPRCGQLFGSILVLLFFVHLLCETVGALAAGAAIMQPKLGPDSKPLIWLAISGLVLLAWIGLLSWFGYF